MDLWKGSVRKEDRDPGPVSKWLGWAPHLQAMKFGHLESKEADP